MTLDDATKTLTANPAALATALRDVRDLHASLKSGHQNPSAHAAAHDAFWRDITDKGAAEKYVLASAELARLGAEVMRRDGEVLAAKAYVRERDRAIRQRDAARVQQQQYAARAGNPLRSIIATLKQRLDQLGADLSRVEGPADLGAWLQALDDALVATHSSAVVALTPPADLAPAVASPKPEPSRTKAA